MADLLRKILSYYVILNILSFYSNLTNPHEIAVYMFVTNAPKQQKCELIDHINSKTLLALLLLCMTERC